jgi:hypothetical protein
MSPAFLYDDAYITLASAEGLWRGTDGHYPGTPPLVGVTSPFHVLLTSLLLPFMNGPLALLSACAIGAAIYAWGLVRVAQAEGLSPSSQACLVLAGCGTGMISQHMVNGLETSWAMAGLVWSVHFVQQRATSRLAVLCGVLPFIRPELAVWSAALLLAELRGGRATIGRTAMLAASGALPWLVLLWWQTGQVLPTTLAAKRDWYAEGCWALGRRATTVAHALGLWLFISGGVAVGLWGLVRKPIGRLALICLAIVLLAWTSSVPSLLDGYHRHRYFAPFLAFLAAGICWVPEPWRARACRFAAALSVVTTSQVLLHEPHLIANAVRQRGEVVAMLQAVHADRVIVHDAGYAAWAGAAPTFVDMVGLKTPLAAALHRQMTGPTCGADRPAALDTLARVESARFLLIWQPWDDAFQVRKGLERAGWRFREDGRTHEQDPIVLYSITPAR